MHRSVQIVVLLAACGRIEFDERELGDSGAIPAEAPRLITAAGQGNAGADDLALADDGRVLLLGGFTGTLELAGDSVPAAASMNDLFVAMLGADGSKGWLWTAGCTTVCNSQGIDWLGEGAVSAGYFGGTLANGGGLMSGSGQDALLMWFAPGGGVQAANQFGASRNVQIRGLDAGAGIVAVGGLYADTVDFGQGALPSAGTNDNAFVAVFDAATRTLRYARAFNGAGDVYVNDVAVAADGGLCVTGRFMAPTDFGGGTATPVSNDAFVVRFDAQGGYRWHRSTGASSSEAGSYVAALDGGDCAVTGYYQGPFTWDGRPLAHAGGDDVYIARLAGADGAVRWVQTVNGPGADGVIGLASHGDDRIAVATAFSAEARVIDRDVTSAGGADLMLAFLDATGTPVAMHHLAGSGGVDGFRGGVAFDPAGRRAGVAFTFDGTLEAAGATVTASANDGGLLVVTAP